MEGIILAPLNALEASLNNLLSSLTTTNTFANAPTAARDLLAADDGLTASLSLLKQHQENHARIVTLRSEADKLQEQLKDIVQNCVELRTEINDIHPSILIEDDSDDEEGGRQIGLQEQREVDYETLLGFAGRIGKHNAAAAREAERDSERRRLETAEQKAKTATEQVNGVSNVALPGVTGEQTATEESKAVLASVNDALAFERANMGMAFPPPDWLRMGMLGQLQLLREQQGEQAVDAEIERLVRASENVDEEESEELQETAALGEPPRVATGTTGRAQQQQPSTRPAQPAPPAKVKPVSLDFDDSDDD